MNVRYEIEDSLKSRADLIDIMKAAGEFLRSRDADPNSTVESVWRLWSGPQGQPFIALQLRDGGYSVTHNYTPAQLVPADIRELRLLDVWNWRLRVQSHRDLARLNELVSQLED
jgi:hypothetical protein